MLTMKDILREGNSILREKAVPVELPLSQDDEHTLIEMINYIFDSIDEKKAEEYHLRSAVGIAAPQIGVLKKMIVIYAFDEDGKEHFYPMVNPRLISYSDELTYLDSGEGCLSVDRVVQGYIHRSKRVTVETYLYIDGKLVKKTIRLKNYLAIIFQHEYDHLFGTLFVDRINSEKPFFVPSNSTPVRFHTNDDEK